MCSPDDGVSFNPTIQCSKCKMSFYATAGATKCDTCSKTPDELVVQTCTYTCTYCGKPFYEYYMSRVYLKVCPNCVKKEGKQVPSESKSERSYQAVICLTKPEIENIVKEKFVGMGYQVTGVDFTGLNNTEPGIKVFMNITNIVPYGISR